MPRRISTAQILQIAAYGLVDYRTVGRAYEGRHVMRPLTHERIARAAKALKLPAPMPLKRAGA